VAYIARGMARGSAARECPSKRIITPSSTSSIEAVGESFSNALRKLKQRWCATFRGFDRFAMALSERDGGRERESSFQKGPAAQELETNFDEFSACSDAEPVFGGVIRVAVIMAPRGILLMIRMPNDRPRDHTDGCADDQSTSYQLFHVALRA
jgi:hypothetical protein